MVAESIISIIQCYLMELQTHGIPVHSAVLYGSFASGEQRPESDIDLLVLSPLFDHEKTTEVIDALWHLVWRVDSRIEPTAVGVREFKENQTSPLIGIAREHGVVIDAKTMDEEEQLHKVAEESPVYGQKH